jgi:ribosomal protein S18 acetylase RimI-like enzyme
LKIESFEISDYPEVIELWRESGLDIRPSDSRAQIIIKLRRDSELFLVAKDRRDVVGAVMGAWDGRRGWIYHLGVSPRFQRRGVASALVLELQKRMRKKGVVKVNALIYPGNSASIGFFKSAGFEILDMKEAQKTLIRDPDIRAKARKAKNSGSKRRSQLGP